MKDYTILMSPKEDEALLDVYEALHLIVPDIDESITTAKNKFYLDMLPRSNITIRHGEKIEDVVREVLADKEIKAEQVCIKRVENPLIPFPARTPDELKEYVSQALDEYMMSRKYGPIATISVQGYRQALHIADKLSAVINFVNNIPIEFVPEQYQDWIVDDNGKEPDPIYNNLLGIGYGNDQKAFGGSEGYYQKAIEVFFDCRDKGLPLRESIKEFEKRTDLRPSSCRSVYRIIAESCERLRFF